MTPLRIGQLATSAGVGVETIRYYERNGLLEEPQFTRPAEFAGWHVPEVLLSGDHGRIEEWRRAQRIARTGQRRPDLLEAWEIAQSDDEG